MMIDNYTEGLNKFYPGQRVVAVDALPGTGFKNGIEYNVAAYEYKPSGNPIANGRSFWYIGIQGYDKGGCYYRPSIFAPIPEVFQTITFEKIIEKELISVN